MPQRLPCLAQISISFIKLARFVQVGGSVTQRFRLAAVISGDLGRLQNLVNRADVPSLYGLSVSVYLPFIPRLLGGAQLLSAAPACSGVRGTQYRHGGGRQKTDQDTMRHPGSSSCPPPRISIPSGDPRQLFPM